jgi:hypothetical protein
MTKHQFELGSTVNVSAKAFGNPPPRNGKVIAELDKGLLLIDFGPTFFGHDGHEGNRPYLKRGKLAATKTCWYVYPSDCEPVIELPAPKPAKPARQAKEQNDRILAHLLAGKTITQLEAFGVYRIFRLAARIHELKAKGHKIVTTMRQDETGKQYAEYSLRNAGRIY